MVVKAKSKLKPLYRLLNRINRKAPRNIQSFAKKANDTVWKDLDCLECANCCKAMTPTYTNTDMKRIAAFLKISVDDMKRRWLRKERGTGDWINKTTPCQFLDMKTNMCSIYEVRPADCAGFPHLSKRKFVDYVHIHKQNVSECPATFKMITTMNEILSLAENKS